MTTDHGAEESARLETISTERRRLIGQAIIDGILSPVEAALLAVKPTVDYNQGNGNYKQRGGGNHGQSGGDYDQARITAVRDEVVDVIREPDPTQQR
jgi:hypothetical protein